MTQPCDSRETSSASEMEESSKVPSLQRSGSISMSDDEGWPTCSSRSRCRRPKWTREEEMVLVEAHCTLGNAWVAIAECLPGRTPSEVKNIWHSTQRARKLQTRSVLRAYVSALKDRADKPAARQQAMRAAQHFLIEGSGKACSPAKRVPRRPAGQRQQQQQQPQQQRLPQPRITGTGASPPPSAAADALSEPEVAAAPGGARRHRGGGAGGQLLLAGDSAAAAAAAAAPAATLAVTAAVAAAAPGHRSTGHRSSLGSEWSCVSSSGALESWPPGTAGGGPTAASGDFANGPTPPPIMSFSPLVNTAASGAATYAAPPPASTTATAWPRAAVITSRFDSPTGPRPDSPPISTPPPPPPPPPAAIRSVHCGGSDWRDTADTKLAAAPQPPTAAVPAWQVPAATAGSTAAAAAAALGHPHPQHAQHEHRQEAYWQRSGWGSDSAAVNHAAAAAWDREPCALAAPPARWGYVVSTGCNGHSGGGADSSSGSGLWTAEGGRRTSAGLPAAGGASWHVHPLPHSTAGQALTSKAFAPPPAARSATAIAAKLLGAVPCMQSAFSGTGVGCGGNSACDGGGGDVVTLGLYGIMDEELLACLRA